MSAEELITDHLDLWTSALTAKSTAGRGRNGKIELTGIKKLRELILELAVRGKLVDQDPDEEPASVLLERIAEEKARLVKEGTIKKPKKLPEITEEEKPFGLPEGWVWTRLGTISQINPRNNADDESLASFIPMPLISTSYHGEHDQEKRLWGEIKKSYTHFADGDIAIAKITPCFENSKAAVFRNLESGIGAGTTELHIARPYGKTLNPFYILLCLKSPRFLNIGEHKMTGSAGQKRVPKDFFSGEPLPFPPLKEQNRIVEKVDELMALCDRLEHQVGDQLEAHEVLVDTLLDALYSADAAELAESWARIAEHFDTLFTTDASIDKLKQSILQLAVMGRLVEQDAGDESALMLLKQISEEKNQLTFQGAIKKPKKRAPIHDAEKLFDLPNGWAWARLEDVFVNIVDCPHSTPKFIDQGKLCLDTNSFKDGKLNPVRFRYVSEDTFEKRNARLQPQTNDIVFAREGSVGESVVIPPKMDFCLGQRVMLFRPSSFSEPNFLRLTLSNPLALDVLLSLHKGIGAKHVNVSDMRKYVIALPPADEQHRIVQKVDELMALCDHLKARLGEAGETRTQLAEAVVEQAVS